MKIACKKSEKGGFGVFATDFIKENELIEICPVLPIHFKEWGCLQHSKLVDYIFEWAPTVEKRIGFILGYGMVYNHSYQPNSRTIRDIHTDTFTFYALRDIEEGEEITHNYNGSPGHTGDVWFEVKE